jgi:ABC-type nickel/cobalt efflux system permease component RcnA
LFSALQQSPALGGLAVAAGLAGILAMGALPLLLGKDWPAQEVMGTARKVAGTLLVLTAFWLIAQSLQLI